uniref:Hes family bHLH transcription factor 1 n=1 Tax=Neogobius melanostomus TaxID=47308 RepID=A0A8C6UPQ1_9GOBI
MPAGTLEQTTPDSLVLTPARTDHKPPRASESRKSSKPIMEKRRRARINESLGQLKMLILEALKKDTSRHSKLEKADILEMTVKHLRNLQRLQLTAAVHADPGLLGKYRAGFSECMGEVTRFLSTCEGVHGEVRARLLNHLASCVSQMSCGALYPAPTSPTLMLGCKATLGPELVSLYSGVQLLPRPEGHVALLVPGVALSPAGPPTSCPPSGPRSPQTLCGGPASAMISSLRIGLSVRKEQSRCWPFWGPKQKSTRGPYSTYASHGYSTKREPVTVAQRLVLVLQS